jgi:hypothetical protein
MSDEVGIDRVRLHLQKWINIVCADVLMVRSTAFVRFIDPKSNPTLAELQDKSKNSVFMLLFLHF